jgi:hypothetical protein
VVAQRRGGTRAAVVDLCLSGVLFDGRRCGYGECCANAETHLKETSSKETGNGFIARDDIFQNGAKVGTGPAVCRYVFPSGSDNPTGASCKATLTLAGGNADHGRVRVPIGQRPREGHWRDGQISGRDRNRRTAAEANNTTASTLHLDDGAPVERDGGFSYASGDVAGSPGGGSPCSRSTTRIGPRVSR